MQRDLQPIQSLSGTKMSYHGSSSFELVPKSIAAAGVRLPRRSPFKLVFSHRIIYSHAPQKCFHYSGDTVCAKAPECMYETATEITDALLSQQFSAARGMTRLLAWMIEMESRFCGESYLFTKKIAFDRFSRMHPG